MTAAGMREQVKSARTTGTAGALVVAIALAMMVIAAPSCPHPGRGYGPAGPAAVTSVTSVTSVRTVATFTQTPAPAAGPVIRP